MIALGGNALQENNNISPKQQIEVCKKTALSAVALVKEAGELLLSGCADKSPGKRTRQINIDLKKIKIVSLTMIADCFSGSVNRNPVPGLFCVVTQTCFLTACRDHLLSYQAIAVMKFPVRKQ